MRKFFRPSHTDKDTTDEVYADPNPVPSAGAVSQTFVRSETTTVIAIPTVTVTITIAGATITVAPGGTPVGGMVPTDVTQPDAVLPTFS